MQLGFWLHPIVPGPDVRTAVVGSIGAPAQAAGNTTLCRPPEATRGDGSSKLA